MGGLEKQQLWMTNSVLDRIEWPLIGIDLQDIGQRNMALDDGGGLLWGRCIDYGNERRLLFSARTLIWNSFDALGEITS